MSTFAGINYGLETLISEWIRVAADENTYIPASEKQGELWQRFRRVLWESRDPEVYAEWYQSLGHNLLPSIGVLWYFFSAGAEEVQP